VTSAWVKRPLLVVLVVVLVIGGVLVSRSYASFRHHRTELTSGVTGGVSWQLVASDPDSQFCLAMSGGSQAEYGASCGFGPASSSYGAAVGSRFPGNANLIFGPAPPKATQVQLSRASAKPQCTTTPGPSVITRSITGELPSWGPSGKWFMVSDSEPLCAWNVSFLDAAGKTIRDHRFS
jgi:hypothetical protein